MAEDRKDLQAGPNGDGDSKLNTGGDVGGPTMAWSNAQVNF